MKHISKKHVIFYAALTALASQSAIAEEQALDTIVVTATRTATPLEQVGSSMTVLTAEDIQERGYTNLADLLSTTTGITISNNGGAGKATSIRIRGEEDFRTKILIDGVDVSDPSSTQIQPAVENISLANVERIEILRGPQGMMYGADAGGVINIITKQANKPLAADFSTEMGRYNTRNTSGDVRGQNGIFDYSFGLSRQDTDGFNAETADTVLRDNDGYGNTTANGSIGAQLTDNIHARYTVRSVNSSNDYDGCYSSDPNVYTTFYNCTNSYMQLLQSVELAQKTDKFSNKISFADNSINRDFYTDGIKGSFYQGDTKQSQYLGTFAVNTDNKLLYGVDYADDELTANSDFSDNGIRARYQTGVYGEWQGAVGKQFFYTLGDRHDDSSDFGSHDSYRTTVAWLQPLGDDELKYKASYGTGFRAPSLYEIAYNHINGFPPATLTTLSPETSKGYDAGVEFHAASGLSLGATYFDQQIEDAIDYDLVNYSGYIQTPGTTHSKGVELSGEMPITHMVSVLGNYTYNDTSDETGEQRLRRPRNSGNLGVRATIEKFSTLVNWRFANDTVDEIYGVGRVPLNNYHIWDITLNYAVTPSLDVYTRAQNIFDEKYQVVTGYNTEGAAVYAGFRAKY
jgi:vitamin B12 transporter